MSRTAKEIVDSEVIYCVSALVYELTQRSDAETLELWNRPATLEDMRQCVQDAEYYTVYKIADDTWRWSLKGDDESDGCGPFNTEEDALRDLIEAEGLDLSDYESEVYEHWIVSDWLARKLQAHGEVVGELYGLTIWGRTTTGQAIYMDGEIQAIAGEIART